MKRSIMIWTISGLIYLGVVIAGYNIYAGMKPEPAADTDGTMKEQMEENMNNHSGMNK